MSNGVILKKRNILNVIKIIKNYGPITKPEISARTKMTSVSIHNFINELLEKNILIENGSSVSNGGRKPTLYKINPSFGYLIGQCLTLTGIRTALFDFSMNKIHSEEVAFSNMNVNAIIILMISRINQIMSDYGKPYNQCLGIGITVPGQINYANGSIKKLTNMPAWDGVPLKNRLVEEFNLPVFVENDNKAIALAIKWVDEVNENSCIAYVDVSTGVGAGILYNGELFNGKHHNAGEIGHIIVDYDGQLCNCGNHGCLELMLSDKGITQRVCNEIRKTETSENLDLLLSAEWNIDLCIRLGKEGNPVVMKTFKEISKYIYICIDNIVKFYDPEEIIIECAWLLAFPEIFEHIVDEFFSKSQWVDKKQVNIRLNRTKDIFTLGAATLVLEDLYKFSNTNMLLNKK